MHMYYIAIRTCTYTMCVATHVYIQYMAITWTDIYTQYVDFEYFTITVWIHIATWLIAKHGTSKVFHMCIYKSVNNNQLLFIQWWLWLHTITSNNGSGEDTIITYSYSFNAANSWLGHHSVTASSYIYYIAMYQFIIIIIA